MLGGRCERGRGEIFVELQFVLEALHVITSRRLPGRHALALRHLLRPPYFTAIAVCTTTLLSSACLSNP